jgi:hypothetical protein
MVIVTDFQCGVKEYVEHFWQLAFPRPDICPTCQALDRLIGHGFYVREPMTLNAVYVVHVKRWLCKECHHTVSLLPSFVLRYRHYLLEVMAPVLVTRFEQAASWTQVARRCTQNGLPYPRTLYRWCVSFAAQAPTWWAAVQRTLAQHDAGSPALDPLGENTGPHEAPRALLQAALHLLAWAKTQWPEIGAYGLADRLRFLWHWGAAQGLGRLI